MRKLLLRFLFFLIPFLWSIYVCSQPKAGRDCSATCFSSEVVSVERTSASCSTYEVKVSYSGPCAHALSHFSMEVPCGRIDDIWNSQNWKQEVGTDPTTGIRGFKIDDISGFGEGLLSSFTVKFTVCVTNDECSDLLKCWQPKVAYKASTCVNYETLDVNCTALKATIEKQDVSCHGANDGSALVRVQDGREPYSFLWSDNATTQSREALAAGVYTVIVRDATGAEISLQETIVQPEKISITGATVAATCNGTADGKIDISVSGGTGEYSFAWSNGMTTEDLQNVNPGQYSVIIKDGEGCTATAGFSVTASSSINIATIPVKPDCNSTNGSVNVSVSGGTAPYSFTWSNGATSEDILNVGAGLYTVTVTDASGCSQARSVLLHENNTLTLNAISSPTACVGDETGALDLSVSGGTGPYTYVWSNGASTEDLTAIGSGLYTVVVTDAKGCKVSGGYTVSRSSFQVARVVTQPTCYGVDDGSITLQEPLGGSGPYTYVWSSGETGPSLHDLEPGTYSVTVTDATGCSRTLTSTIAYPQQISVSGQVSESSCNQPGEATIDLIVSGGTAPYDFLWSNGSTTEDQTGLVNGTYQVTVTDARGCSANGEFIVRMESNAWSCFIDELASPPVCGSDNNTLSTQVTGADSYHWSVDSQDPGWSIADADAPSIVFNAGNANSSATFTLTITKDGCTRSCSYVINTCLTDDEGEPGGGEPGNEGPGEGSETCEECFVTIGKLVASSGNCHTYEMEVATNGNCRHDLSHWTLAIPCGTISDYWNSNGWKMEYGKDPTTGLNGLKVDDIGSFGKQEDSFTVRFTLCGGDNCDLSYWDPTIAYKAGQCVGIETIRLSTGSSDARMVSVFPNPFNEVIRFEWRAISDNVSLDVIDQYGNTVSRTTKPSGKHDAYYITLESSAIPRGMYYYRLTADGKTSYGKISKR